VDIGVEANHVFLKPRRAGERMNLILLSDRRTYRFDYQADTSRGTDARDVTYALVFEYASPPTPAAAVADVRAWNANYWYCGAPQMQPREVFDDGIRTYLRFAATVELPVVYLVEADGAERLVNSHVSGDWIIVHQTTRRLALRRGALAGCIENRTTREGLSEPDHVPTVDDGMGRQGRS
jgi:type IV secretion system protein VirB9